MIIHAAGFFAVHPQSRNRIHRPLAKTLFLFLLAVSCLGLISCAQAAFTGGGQHVQVSLSVGAQSLQVAQSANFSVTILNDSSNKGVTWSVSGAGCTSNSCGTLTNVTATSVTYTAPAAVPNPPAVTLKATSVADPSALGSVTITITAPSVISVSVNPSTTAVQVLQTAGFMATVQNDAANKGVTWSLSGGGTLTNATTTSVTYTAPASVPTPATVTLTATSVTDGTKTGAAMITVTLAPVIVVAVSPPAANVQAGIGTQPFTATVTNDMLNKGVTWTLSGAGCNGVACGTLSASSSASGAVISYRAPASVPTPAAVALTATSVSDGTKTGVSTITVTSPVSVSVSPLTANVQVSQTQSFAATVSNDPQNKGVTWSVAGTGCSGNNCGTLSASSSAFGVAVTYTAPASVPAPATVTLRATSASDPSVSSSATITITAPPPISVVVTPPSASVQVSHPAGFTATVQNDSSNKGVAWSLAGAGCSGAACGTLTNVTTTSVTYNAPSGVPSPATVTLTATSVADGTKSAMATITVTAAPPPISVSVSPPSASVQVSQMASFTATVQNDAQNKGVTWSLSGTGCSGNTCGTLSASSSTSGAAITYTAPANVPTPAAVILTASSVTDGTKTAAATITVTAAPVIVVAVSPTSANVQAGIGTQSFTATVTNDARNQGVTWSLSGTGCSGSTCGTLSANSSASGGVIIYTAPASVPTPATVTLVATSASDGTKLSSGIITVTSPVSVSASPAAASVQVSQTQSFAATVSNDSQNKGVNWLLSGVGCSGSTCGTLSANSSASGVTIAYTAPASVPTPATVTLTATAASDGTKTAAATITITPAPVIMVTVSPTTANVQASIGTQTFTATVTNDTQNKGVTWTLSGAGCSGAACGTLSATSSASGVAITYSAPAAVPTPATVTLKANSVADNTKSATATITITAAPPPGATPALVQMSACSMALNPDRSAQTQMDYTCPLPNGTLASNTVIFAVAFAPAGTVTHVVSDENGDTFTEEQSTTDSTNAVRTVLFCGQPTAGSHKFKVTFTGTARNTLTQAFEFNNITNCSKETSNGHVGAASTSLTAGSITPTTTGDFLFQFSSLTTQLTTASWAAGSQSNITWALASSDINTGAAAQWGQYNSTAPIDPTMTQGTSLQYVSAAVALRTSAVGSARPGGGIYVVGVHHNNYGNSSPSTIKAQIPVMGNLIAVQYGAISTYNVNSIADGTNAYTEIGTAAANNSSCQDFYAKNVTPAASYTLSMAMTEGGKTADNATAFIFDIANADTSAPLDSTLGHKTATGTQATGGAGGPLTFWTDLTPTATNELIMVHSGQQNDSATGVTQPTGAVFLSSYWNTAVNPTMADENDFHGMFYNGASTAAETWTMAHDTINTPGIGTWSACGVAFKGPSGVAPPPLIVSVNPPTATVQVLQTTGFSASVQNAGANNGVTWSLSGTGCSGSTCGTLSTSSSTSGVAITYTAPTSVPAPAIVTLTATSVADGTKSAAATIAVVAALPQVTISPRRGSLTLMQMLQLQTNLPASSVTWSVDAVTAGNSTVGTISPAGLFIPGTAVGAHNITVTVNGNASNNATAVIAVTDYAGTLTHQNDNARTGQNVQEYALTPLTVNSAQFAKLFTQSIDGWAYAQPLWAPGVAISGKGTHNVVFVATMNNTVYAFDADTMQAALWQKNLTPAGESTATPAQVNDTNILVNIGIIGTPAIDTSTGTLYVVAKTCDAASCGSSSDSNYHQRLHALDVTTGNEKPNSPVEIVASVPGGGIGTSNGQIAFSPLHHMQRPGLLVSNGVVYVGLGSHDDKEPYHGWVLGYNATTLQQTMAYCTTPDGSEGSIWMAGAGLTADSAGNIYFITANGTFNADLGGHDYSDSIVKLSPSGSVLDYFTPNNQADLSARDVDLGSAGAMILPDQSGAHTHEVLGGGKGGMWYLLDRDNMGHFNAVDNSQIVQSVTVNLTAGAVFSGLFDSPAYWNGNVYVSANVDALKAYSLTSGLLSFSPLSTSNVGNFSYPAPPPAVSASGTTNGIVWVMSSAGSTLHAFDALNLATELYNSGQAAGNRDQTGPGVKFSLPTVANGKVYVGTKTELDVFGLLP